MNKTMKKRLFFLLIVAALFLVSGCAVKTITNEAGETVTKLIYTTTTFKETMDTESFFDALLVWRAENLPVDKRAVARKSYATRAYSSQRKGYVFSLLVFVNHNFLPT